MERVARLAEHLGAAAESRTQQAPSAVQQPTAAPSGEHKFKVAVLGAGGGIGQPLALLLKLNPRVSELSLYDIVGTEGVAADLSHINTGAKVSGHTGPAALGAALFGCRLVLIPAGVPRKPGMTRDDLFNINAGIVRDLAAAVARFCPNALVAIISNPVNSTVPIAAEVLKRAGCFDPKRLLGVTALDVIRANAFAAEAAGLDPEAVSVPVIGGHAGVTILPLLSQASPPLRLDEATAKALTERIQDAGTEVVRAKAGKGSATLSMAHAAARFGDACLRALAGEADVVECAFVASHLTHLPFFASRLRLGPAGVEEFLPLGRLSAAEAAGLEALQPELAASIQKGVDFVAAQPGKQLG